VCVGTLPRLFPPFPLHFFFIRVFFSTLFFPFFFLRFCFPPSLFSFVGCFWRSLGEITKAPFFSPRAPFFFSVAEKRPFHGTLLSPPQPFTPLPLREGHGPPQERRLFRRSSPGRHYPHLFRPVPQPARFFSFFKASLCVFRDLRKQFPFPFLPRISLFATRHPKGKIGFFPADQTLFSAQKIRATAPRAGPPNPPQ